MELRSVVIEAGRIVEMPGGIFISPQQACDIVSIGGQPGAATFRREIELSPDAPFTSRVRCAET
jgi:hypothetical protein